MNTKEDFHKQLVDWGFFTGEIHPILLKLEKSVNVNIPRKMKLSIAASEAVLFASQFRRNIKMRDGVTLPTNSITFILAQSGASKDRTANTMRSCFKHGYDYVDEQREELALTYAMEKAREEGDADPEATKSWKKYYKKPRPLFATISTLEGMIKYMNELEDTSVGAAHIYTGELGDALCSNTDMGNILTLLSEMYDLGKREVKIIKSEEGQSRPIRCLPMSALFIGSQAKILMDDTIKGVFKREFISKLSRRAFLNYNKDPLTPDHGETIEQLLGRESAADTAAMKIKDELNSLSYDIAEHNFKHKLGRPVKSDVYNEYQIYKHYNECISETEIDETLYEMSFLSRRHAQWRALKLAGALAVLDRSETITRDHFRFAVNYLELIDEDIFLFEDELRKAKYEQFIDYMNANVKDKEYTINAHKLGKLGFVGSKTTKSDMKQLVFLASDADKDAVYELQDSSIKITKLIKTDILGASYKVFDPTWDKEKRTHHSSDGYEYIPDLQFKDLRDLLSGDFAYLPFELKDGHRSNANLIGETKWVALDVDDSSITAKEMHEILEDLNHHIALTTDATNPYKYRILLELDSPVDVSEKLWKQFINLISFDLGIKCDLLPKAQFFIGWKDREVFSVTDKKRLEVKGYLDSLSREEVKLVKKVSSAKEKKDILENPQETFFYAYEAEPGKKRSLYKLMKHAYDLGLEYEETKKIMEDVRRYWAEEINPVWYANFLEQTKRQFGYTDLLI